MKVSLFSLNLRVLSLEPLRGWVGLISTVRVSKFYQVFIYGHDCMSTSRGCTPAPHVLKPLPHEPRGPLCRHAVCARPPSSSGHAPRSPPALKATWACGVTVGLSAAFWTWDRLASAPSPQLLRTGSRLNSGSAPCTDSAPPPGLAISLYRGWRHALPVHWWPPGPGAALLCWLVAPRVSCPEFCLSWPSAHPGGSGRSPAHPCTLCPMLELP